MAVVLVVDPLAPDRAVIRRAAAALRAGQLVAFPTETVYGLGANALDAAAVQGLFTAKGRPAADPIIVHVLGVGDLAAVAIEVSPLARQLAAAFWPGPLTLVLPRGSAVPDAVTAGLDSVAVRAPSHPVARALLAAAGVPVAAPSANRFGHTSPTTAQHVLDDLGDVVDVVLDGGSTPVGVESTVLDVRVHPPRVLRPGGVTLEALRRIVPGVTLGRAGGEQGPQRAPGQLSRHYATRATLVLVLGAPEAVPAALAAAAGELTAAGRRVGLLVAEEDLVPIAAAATGAIVRSLASLHDLAAAAQGLFATLRALDDEEVDVILARDWGDTGLALALRDRLTRAAEGRAVVVEGNVAADAASIVAAVV